MDKLAEAIVLSQRGGLGIADEEVDELGIEALLCFLRQLYCLVHFQLLHAAAAAVAGGGGRAMVVPGLVLHDVGVDTVRNPLAALHAEDVLLVVLVVAGEVIAPLPDRVFLAVVGGRVLELPLVDDFNSLVLLPAFGLRGRVPNRRGHREARDASGRHPVVWGMVGLVISQYV